MEFLLTFFEGIVTFASPCFLPMLPVYVLYLSGEERGKQADRIAVGRALAFVSGFTLAFLIMGAFAGTLGSLLFRYERLLQILGGCVIILFGLHQMGVPLRFLPGGAHTEDAHTGGGVGAGQSRRVTGTLSAALFGLVFSVSWTPCMSAFLGSALVLAAQKGSVSYGMLLLLCYSAGLGLPFLIGAYFLQRGKTRFRAIRRRLPFISKLSGGLLIVMGLLMASGIWEALMIRFGLH